MRCKNTKYNSQYGSRKDQNSKFEVQLLLNAYRFCIIVNIISRIVVSQGLYCCIKEVKYYFYIKLIKSFY